MFSLNKFNLFFDKYGKKIESFSILLIILISIFKKLNHLLIYQLYQTLLIHQILPSYNKLTNKRKKILNHMTSQFLIRSLFSITFFYPYESNLNSYL